jgi:AraC family transcriptional regulator of adaptative response/methylated-DNA-[protein]-cysteine methyltransferase
MMNTATPQPTVEEMVHAMRENDAGYDGRFYVCVTSTRIFCLPSCKAKTPKLDHVVFVSSREDAVRMGFRGCKRCRAEFYPDTKPPWLILLVDHLRRNPDAKIRELELARHAGVDISTVRRYFRTYLHTTPVAYHRKMRMMRARDLLKAGTDFVSAAYESGFESPSGFRDAFIREFGYPPGRVYAGRRNRVPARTDADR